MSERVPRPANAAKCNWATGGGAYPKGDPGSGKRDVGYKPKDYPTAGAGDVIPAEDHNFLWNLGMDMISWQRDFVPAEWSDISEGITNSSAVSQLFRVYAPTTGIRVRGSLAYSAAGTAASGGNVRLLITDGERLYYNSGSPNNDIIAADPTNGSELWESDPDSQTISALATDGGYVYYTTSNAGAAGLRRLNRDTGAYQTAGGTEYNLQDLATNGEYCVGIDGAVSGNGYITFWSGIQGTIVQDGQVNPTTNLADIAIDNQRCFATGIRNTYDVWAYTLNTRALRWQATLPTTGAPTCNGIATDGTLVYVVTDRIALSAGGNANLFVFDRDGNYLFAVDHTTANFDWVAVDDTYLYLVDNLDNCRVIEKSYLPTVVQVTVVVDVDGLPACDGVSIICRDATSPTLFERRWFTGATKTFMRAGSNDPNRRPFFNLAVPTNERT